MKSEATYIGCRQRVVASWVALLPIFKVCAREKGYAVGRGQGVPMVETGVFIKAAQGNLGGDLVGGQDNV